MQATVSLKDEILERVDFNAFFAANIKDWKLSPRGDQGMGFCPIPTHQDDRRSFSGNATNGFWNCKGCGAKGDFFTLWGLFHNMNPSRDFKEMLPMIAAELAIDTQAPSSEKRNGPRPPPAEKPSVAAPPIPEKILEILKRDLTQPLLESLVKARGDTLTEEVLRDFEIGWDAARKRYAIPVRDEAGKLRNIRLYNPVMDPKIISWFHYECPACKLVFRDVIRKGRQFFCQKCGGEIPKEGYKTFGDARLFPLQKFVQSNPGEFLFCEGEFDCICLWNRGLPTLTGTGGAGTFKKEWLPYFRGRRAVLIFDCDPPGLKESAKHAQTIIKDGGVVALKVVKLPLAGTKPEKDITDWYRIGRTTAELIKVIKDAKAIEPPKQKSQAEEEEFLTYHMVAREFMKTPYCQRGSCACTLRNWREDFYMWTGNHYALQAKSDVKMMICRFLERYPALLARKSLTSLINDIAAAVTQELLIPFDLEPPMLFNQQENRFKPVNEIISFENGLLDLTQALDGEPMLMKHSPNYFILKALPYKYDPSATCPNWIDYLNYCWPDPTVRKCLQEFAGLCLTPDIKYQKFMILLGEGGTGKSTFINALVDMLGQANVSACSMHQLGEQFGLWPLVGKNLNVAGEVQDIDLKGEGILKQIAGGDTIEIDRKFRDSLNVVLTTRMIFAANQVPRFADKSAGLWRKLLLIPCDVVIPDDKKDIHLPARIRQEMPGIFNWALEGMRALHISKIFTEPPVMKNFKEDARSEMNPARMFLDDSTAAIEGKETKSAVLYVKYSSWCESNGYRPLNERHFGKEVARYFGKRVERVKLRVPGGRAYAYRGICLLDELGIIPEDKDEQQYF